MTPDKTYIFYLIFWEEQGKLCATAKVSGAENLTPKNREIANMAITRIVEYMKEYGEDYESLRKEQSNDR